MVHPHIYPKIVYRWHCSAAPAPRLTVLCDALEVDAIARVRVGAQAKQAAGPRKFVFCGTAGLGGAWEKFGK